MVTGYTGGDFDFIEKTVQLNTEKTDKYGRIYSKKCMNKAIEDYCKKK